MNHDSTNAFTHGRDVQTALDLEEFREQMINDQGKLKPIFIISADGGSEKAPRYPKTLAVAVDRFREHDLDAHILYTNAPGYSAYSRVERRMAPLSKKLPGLVLPHDSCGTHLDDSGRTIDEELEKVNFEKGGNFLAEVFGNTVIDSHPVIAEFDKDDQISVCNVDEQWLARHVRQSQYVLQIIKCSDVTCCLEWRSNWLKVVTFRFLPAPYPLHQTMNGVIVPEPKNHIKMDEKKNPFTYLRIYVFN